MTENLNMDSFIRDTLSSLRRPRDVDLYSGQPLISTSSTTFTTSSIPDVTTDGATKGYLMDPPAQLAHPWKVYLADTDVISWDVVGDPVWTQAEGGSIDTLWFSDAETGGPGLTNVVGDVGYILLKIIRDEDSREATEVSLEFADEVPESDYYNQYRVIAYVDSEAAEPILQKQFEEIRIFEDLAVVNGEFQLVGLEMSHRNYYEPPP